MFWLKEDSGLVQLRKELDAESDILRGPYVFQVSLARTGNTRSFVVIVVIIIIIIIIIYFVFLSPCFHGTVEKCPNLFNLRTSNPITASRVFFYLLPNNGQYIVSVDETLWIPNEGLCFPTVGS